MKKQKVKFKICFLFLALAIFAAALSACNNTETQNTSEKSLAEAKAELTLAAEPVETAIFLPSSGLNNASISWISSNPSVIGNDGVVILRPVNDTAVKFTAEISIDNISVTKEFEVKVKERDKSLYKANFENGNNDIFFGDIIENDSTIIVKDTGFTRFGEYRSIWNGGFTAGIEIYIDPDAFSPGEYFTWSAALSSSTGEYLTEKFVNFRKTGESFKIGTAGVNSCDECNLASIEHETSIIISDADFYTVTVKYYESGGVIMNECQIMKSSDSSVIHSEIYSQNLPVNSAGGNRYGWFSLMEAKSGVEIRSVWLGNP